MKEVSLKSLKQGDFFTLKPIEEAKESQVYVRQHYDHGSRTYSACRYGDISKERFFKGNRKVYVDFIF